MKSDPSRVKYVLMAIIPVVFNLDWQSNLMTLCSAIVVRIFTNEKSMKLLFASPLLVSIQAICLFVIVLIKLFFLNLL